MQYGFTAKTKRLISALLAALMLATVMPAAVFAEPKTVGVTVTIADSGSLVTDKSGDKVVLRQISVKDPEGDGINIDDVLKAAHEELYDGADGYESYNDESYGLSISKLWGDESFCYGYYVNDASAWSLADPVAEGSHVYAFIYKDKTGWSDSYSFFDKTGYSAVKTEDGYEIDVVLKYGTYDTDWTPISAPLAGATITVDGAATTAVTGSDGKATVRLSSLSEGKHVISAVKSDMNLVPPVALLEGTCVNALVTIADAGSFVTDRNGEKVVRRKIQVSDPEGDGICIDDVLKAAHDEFYNGTDGYLSASGEWGLSLVKLWGDTSYAFGYYVNDASAWSLEDSVSEGDHVYAFIYSDKTGYSDAYGFFDKPEYTAVESGGDSYIEVLLKNSYYDDTFTLVTEPLAGATVTVDGTETAAVTGSDGKATVKVSGLSDGTHLISAVKSGIYLVPPAAFVKETVESGLAAKINATEKSYYKNSTISQLSVTVSTKKTVSGQTFQWYVADSETGEGTEISGATAKTYKPAAFTESGTFYYYCVVSGTCEGTKISAESGRCKTTVDLTKLVPVNITKQPASASYYTKTVPEALTITANATGASGAKLEYQWYRADSETGKGEAIEGATTNKLELAAEDGACTYYYYCVASYAYGEETASLESQRACIEISDVGEAMKSSGSSLRTEKKGLWIVGSKIEDDEGTSSNPFLLESEDDLATLRKLVNEDGISFEGYYFRITKDIKVTEWNGSIGTAETAFSGTVKGEDHIITFTCDSAKPLFGYVRGATLGDFSISARYIDGNALIGWCGIDAWQKEVATINNVNLIGKTKVGGRGYISGGDDAAQYGNFTRAANTVKFINCTVGKDVIIGCNPDGSSKGLDYVGSFAGVAAAELDHCQSEATVMGHDYVGGLVGYQGNSKHKIKAYNCKFGGTVTGNEYVGGIAGSGLIESTARTADRMEIKNCSVTGTVKGNAAVGGILGGDYGTFQTYTEPSALYICNNLVTGTVTGTGDVGMIIGRLRCIDAFTNIENNLYLDDAGTKEPFGSVYLVDTEGHETGKYEDTYYINTATVKNWSTISGIDAYYKSCLTKHQRKDDPLGKDSSELTAAVTSKMLKNGQATEMLNSGDNSSGDWEDGVDGVPATAYRYTKLSKGRIPLENSVQFTSDSDDTTYFINKPSGGVIYVPVISDITFEDFAIETTGGLKAEILDFDPEKYGSVGELYCIVESGNMYKRKANGGIVKGEYGNPVLNPAGETLENLDYEKAVVLRDQMNRESKNHFYKVVLQKNVYVAKITVPKNYSVTYKCGTFTLTGTYDGRQYESREITIVSDVDIFEYGYFKFVAIDCEDELPVNSPEAKGYSAYGVYEIDSIGPYELENMHPTVVSTTEFKTVWGKDLVLNCFDTAIITIKGVSEEQKGVNFINNISEAADTETDEDSDTETTTTTTGTTVSTTTKVTENGKEKTTTVTSYELRFYGTQQIMSDFEIEWHTGIDYIDLCDNLEARLEEDDEVTYYILKDGYLFDSFTVDYSDLKEIREEVVLTLEGHAGETLGKYTITLDPPAEAENGEENPNTGFDFFPVRPAAVREAGKAMR